MSSLPRSVFTTDALPEKDRFAAWREDISVIFDVEDAPVAEAAPHHASFDVFHFGQSVMADLRASSGRYVRTKRKASRDGLDAILLQLFLEGDVQFGNGRRTTYAQAGDIVIFDLAQPVDNINSKFRHITCMWPRAAIEAVLPDIGRWHGHTLPKDNPAVSILRSHIVSCFEMAGRLNQEQGRSVEAATLSLVGAAMAGTNLTNESKAHPAMAEVLTYQLKRYIRENLSSSLVSPASIAQQFGISRTRLYQLLEPIGGIAHYQRHLRLQHCLADLQNPAESQLQISEIAYRWGFSHLATFNRNFRKAFGVAPGEARDQAVNSSHQFAGLPKHSSQQTDILKEHHQWFHTIGI